MDLKAKIFIAGHRGLAGSALTKLLETRGHSNIIKRSHAQMDLTDQPAVEAFFKTGKAGIRVFSRCQGRRHHGEKDLPRRLCRLESGSTK